MPIAVIKLQQLREYPSWNRKQSAGGCSQSLDQRFAHTGRSGTSLPHRPEIMLPSQVVVHYKCVFVKQKLPVFWINQKTRDRTTPTPQAEASPTRWRGREASCGRVQGNVRACLWPTQKAVHILESNSKAFRSSTTHSVDEEMWINQVEICHSIGLGPRSI